MKLNLTLLLAFLIGFSTINIAQVSKTKKEAQIEFDQLAYDFGTIDQGEKVTHEFNFSNTGDKPLIISNAKGSCGCTIPSWPKDPIQPGESGQVVVVFDSKGKKGKQNKRVTLVTNTSAIQSYLSIRGIVAKRTFELTPPLEKVNQEPTINTYDIAVTKTNDLPSTTITLYPNPTKHLLNLSIKEEMGNTATIEIFNELGLLLEFKIVENISEEVIQFDVSKYVAGTYTLTFRTADKKSISKQFVIVNE